jgi:hypothetical protein
MLEQAYKLNQTEVYVLLAYHYHIIYARGADSQ